MEGPYLDAGDAIDANPLSGTSHITFPPPPPPPPPPLPFHPLSLVRFLSAFYFIRIFSLSKKGGAHTHTHTQIERKRKKGRVWVGGWIERQKERQREGMGGGGRGGVPSMYLPLFFHILNIHPLKRCDVQMVGRARADLKDHSISYLLITRSIFRRLIHSGLHHAHEYCRHNAAASTIITSNF